MFVCLILIGSAHSRLKRNIALFSVRGPGRHSLHYSIVYLYSDGLPVCSWHKGHRICEHLAQMAQAIGVSLKRLRNLHDQEYERRIRARGKISFIRKPVSRRKIPVPVTERYVMCV